MSNSTVPFDASIGRQSYCRLRIGWMVGPGYGPVDPNIQATVPAVTMALKHIGLFVEQVRITAIERDFILDVFNKLRVMEMKPASARATVGHEDLVFKMSKTMPAIADTSLQD
ncbi:hypothetical protein VC279_18800 [Xanthomonas sp. WHRI 10064A]|nr:MULTISPECIES: hypothetical protein [unclassified Xanthomonas]MEA9589403.1 hypothetical protein [Xanthomonas sp. WHRI 10064B]MEA9616674.1 hypothetical protein [Xanthomonas sp. WHRI 10064A]